MNTDGLIEGFMSHFLVVLFFFATSKALCGAVIPQKEVRKQKLIFYIEMGDCFLFTSRYQGGNSSSKVFPAMPWGVTEHI